MDNEGQRETRGIELPPPPPTVCPLCGWQTLFDDAVCGVDPPLYCVECEWQGTREELGDALVEKANEWWRDLPSFFQHVLGTKRGEATIYRLAYGLLDAGIDPKIALEILRRVNETLDYRVLYGELEEVALRAARDVKAKRAARGQQTHAHKFGRRAIDLDDLEPEP